MLSSSHTVRALGSALFMALTAVACSSGSQSTTGGGGNVVADAAAPTELPADVGKSCSAGCDKDLCVVTSQPNCLSGDCLLDARGGLTALDSYCTGDCRAASCPTGFACQAVPSALTGESLQRCVKDGTALPPVDAGKAAAVVACEYTLDGCGTICGRTGKTCSTKCSQFAGGTGQTFANEASCKASTGAIDTLSKCGGGTIAEWKRCCCE